MQNELAQRQTELFSVADDFIDAREEWGNDATQEMLPIGGRFWRAAEKLIATFATGHLPAACRDFARTVDWFASHWVPFANMATMEGNPLTSPTRDCWKAADAIAERRQLSMPRGPIRIESIPQLDAQGLSDMQIANLKDWYRPDGAPDVDRVCRARANPALDQLYKGDDQNQALAEQQREIGRTIEAKADARAEADAGPPIAPQTVADLFYQGLTVDQIVNTLRISRDRVIYMAASCGISEDILTAPVVKTQGYEVQPNDSQVRQTEAAANGPPAGSVKKNGAAKRSPTGKFVKKETKEAKVIDLGEDSTLGEDATFDGDTTEKVDDVLAGRVALAVEQGMSDVAIAQIMGLSRQKVASLRKLAKQPV